MPWGLCSGLLDILTSMAIVFLAAALIVGVISAALSFGTAKPDFGAADAAAGQTITPLLEALKGLIEALGSAPAWFALFLAGILLFWVSGEVHVHACKPDFKRTETVTRSTVISRTEGPKPANPSAPVQRPAPR